MPAIKQVHNNVSFLPSFTSPNPPLCNVYPLTRALPLGAVENETALFQMAFEGSYHVLPQSSLSKGENTQFIQPFLLKTGFDF